MRDNDEAQARSEPVTAVILVAAGRGRRLERGVPKASVPLAGVPMLAYALRSVLAVGIARQICVVLPPGENTLSRYCAEIQVKLADLGVQHAAAVRVTVAKGGESRLDSVRNALAVLDEDITAVLIHDAARPLTPAEVFHRVHQSLAAGAVAVVPALAVVDTMKTAEDSSDPQIAPEQVAGTLERARLRRVQTPQGFDLATLRMAHDEVRELSAEQVTGITDDAMLIEALGLPVHLVRGSEMSLKITTPHDLLVVEALLASPLAPELAPKGVQE